MAATVASVSALAFPKILDVLSTPAMVSLYSLAGVLEPLTTVVFFPAVFAGVFLTVAFLTAPFLGVALARFDAFVASPASSESVSLL